MVVMIAPVHGEVKSQAIRFRTIAHLPTASDDWLEGVVDSFIREEGALK